MYYKKIVGERLYLSPVDIDNEVKTMTRWMNEDQDIAYFNGFYGSLLGEDKVRERLVATETMEVPRINEHINPEYTEYKKRFRY